MESKSYSFRELLSGCKNSNYMRKYVLYFKLRAVGTLFRKGSKNILAESYVGVLHNAEKKNIHVYADYKGEHEVFVDYKWTIEAVFNVIDNAVKYTEQNGNIKIEIVTSDNFEIISIADDGSGIEEDKIPLIFKRFYREEKSKQIEGVGLGLSLSKEIIEKEHGYIRVKSILHQGTTFYIYLPRREKESENNG